MASDCSPISQDLCFLFSSAFFFCVSRIYNISDFVNRYGRDTGKKTDFSLWCRHTKKFAVPSGVLDPRPYNPQTYWFYETFRSCFSRICDPLGKIWPPESAAPLAVPRRVRPMCFNQPL